ncbi:uracil phosphoribosyltransferase [soil metagenome]
MPPASFTVLDHPLAGDLLTRLRDRETGPAEYRALARRLGLLLMAEATRDLATESRKIETPLEPFEGTRIAKTVVAIPVLRAGLGLLEAVTELFPDAVVGYLGMERDEHTHEPRDYYSKLPDLAGRKALVVDPMLATGGSGSAAVGYVKDAGADDITFVCVVASPEGLARLQADHPYVPIVAAALDRQLNEHAYIVPGLGDFGDRLYGTF